MALTVPPSDQTGSREGGRVLSSVVYGWLVVAGGSLRISADPADKLQRADAQEVFGNL